MHVLHTELTLSVRMSNWCEVRTPSRIAQSPPHDQLHIHALKNTHITYVECAHKELMRRFHTLISAGLTAEHENASHKVHYAIQ